MHLLLLSDPKGVPKRVLQSDPKHNNKVASVSI